jgi:hypothetical protein
MISFEVWLPLGALALYLFDSTQWLYANELILLHGGGKWRCARIPAWLVSGRRVYIPNPLTPGTPQFKVRWSDTDRREEQEDVAALASFFHALRPVQYLVNTLLVILLVLPVELLLHGTGVELLALMAVFYLVSIVALVVVYVRRRELRLTGRAFAALSFDALACAPFAINLVRKLTLRRSLAGNPLEFAVRAFEPAALARMVDNVTARVKEEQVREVAHSPRWEELEAYQQKLNALREGSGGAATPTASSAFTDEQQQG